MFVIKRLRARQEWQFFGALPKADPVLATVWWALLLLNGASYVIDCGNGVARQMVLAKLKLSSMRSVFLTHQHSDHNADYGNLLLLAWATDLTKRVDTYGPPPIAEMTKQFLALNDYDIRTRIADEGRAPLKDLIVPHEIPYDAQHPR